MYLHRNKFSKLNYIFILFGNIMNIFWQHEDDCKSFNFVSKWGYDRFQLWILIIINIHLKS